MAARANATPNIRLAGADPGPATRATHPTRWTPKDGGRDPERRSVETQTGAQSRQVRQNGLGFVGTKQQRGLSNSVRLEP